jgi:hypothetical protein
VKWRRAPCCCHPGTSEQLATSAAGAREGTAKAQKSRKIVKRKCRKEIFMIGFRNGEFTADVLRRKIDAQRQMSGVTVLLKPDT